LVYWYAIHLLIMRDTPQKNSILQHLFDYVCNTFPKVLSNA